MNVRSILLIKRTLKSVTFFLPPYSIRVVWRRCYSWSRGLVPGDIVEIVIFIFVARWYGVGRCRARSEGFLSH